MFSFEFFFSHFESNHDTWYGLTVARHFAVVFVPNVSLPLYVHQAIVVIILEANDVPHFTDVILTTLIAFVLE